MEPPGSPSQKPRRPRRSLSPETRDYEATGGGHGSRQRSPGHHRQDRSSFGRGGREQDGGYGDRDRIRQRESEKAREDPRDGSGSRANDRYDGRDIKRRRGDDMRDDGRKDKGSRSGDYSERDREKERERDRGKYELEAKGEGGEIVKAEMEKPNFGSSGLLAKETNTVKGVQLKYNEPPEARKPLRNWRLYVFKGKEQLDLIHIYKQSAYLIGRDTAVTDIPIAHPSCSKQHAAIQYRQISEKNEYGDVTTSVKPFIIDLESTNGTHVNDQEIPKTRYYELRNTDVIKFGTSSREYVLLHEEA